MVTSVDVGPYYVVGVSRLGNLNAPRHCASSAPFNASLFPWAPSTNPSYFVVFFNSGGAGYKLKYHNAGAKVICEE
jgi:hypothetical protein